MKYQSEGWTLGEVGDLMGNGLRVGDRVSHTGIGLGWVSNIWSDRDSYVHTKHDPDTWEHGKPAHGSWTTTERVIPIVTDEEVAEAFGLKELP